MVGGDGHAQVGCDLHPAGVVPLDGSVPFGRAGGDRPPGGRTGGGPARPARGSERLRARPGRRRRRPSRGARPSHRSRAARRRWGSTSSTSATESTGRLGFHARVAGNVVAMVERELALGEGHATRHAARLADLGVADDEELASRIRSGVMDDDWHAVAAVVRESVRDKLSVSHPGILAAGRPGRAGHRAGQRRRLVDGGRRSEATASRSCRPISTMRRCRWARACSTVGCRTAASA